MDLMSNKIGRDELRPGDHIYTWRSGYSYSHHGIYVGDGKVIHLTRGPGLIISSSSYRSQSNDRVECCNIEDFVCDGQLYRFEYGVSRFVLLMKRAGTCSRVPSSPPEKVLHRASYLLENGFGNYHLLNKNCEDFALYCKTGIVRGDIIWMGISAQIQFLAAAIITMLLIPYQFLPASLIGVALMVCGLYCFLRLAVDAGFTSAEDCDIVEVEKLDHNVWENMTMMENPIARGFQRKTYYLAYTLWVIRIWYWTPKSEVLVWLKSYCIYFLSCSFVSIYLRLHGFEVVEYIASATWVLGYLYWRWRSQSTAVVCTRVSFVLSFLCSFFSDSPTRLKLNHVGETTLVLGFWDWTPRITILVWIKLAVLYYFSFLFFSNRLRNNLLMLHHQRLMRGAFLACFVIQSTVLFLGLD